MSQVHWYIQSQTALQRSPLGHESFHCTTMPDCGSYGPAVLPLHLESNRKVVLVVFIWHLVTRDLIAEFCTHLWNINTDWSARSHSDLTFVPKIRCFLKKTCFTNWCDAILKKWLLGLCHCLLLETKCSRLLTRHPYVYFPLSVYCPYGLWSGTV